jgi:TonB family protein
LARRRDIPWGLWLGCLAAALLAHALLMLPSGHVLARSLGKGFAPRASEREAFELELIEPEQTEALQFVAHSQPNDRRPSETARIAERDSDVEQEREAAPVRAASVAGHSGTAKLAQESGEPKPDTPPPEPDTLAPEDVVEAEDGQLASAEPPPPEPTADPAQQWRMLAGSPDVLRDNFAAPRPAAAVLPKTERERETLLDSRKHLFAGFYARMHERILEHYDCDAAIARHDPHRIQLGAEQRITIVRVQLDRTGAIEKLSFLQESEVEYLDAEAIRTIRAAGPFPNPPDELFDDEGALVIRVVFKVNPDGSAGVDRPYR